MEKMEGGLEIDRLSGEGLLGGRGASQKRTEEWGR